MNFFLWIKLSACTFCTVYYFVNIDCMLVFFLNALLLLHNVFFVLLHLLPDVDVSTKLWQSVEVCGWQLFMENKDT